MPIYLTEPWKSQPMDASGFEVEQKPGGVEHHARFYRMCHEKLMDAVQAGREDDAYAFAWYLGRGVSRYGYRIFGGK